MAKIVIIVLSSPTPRVTWSTELTSDRLFMSNTSYGQELVIRQVDFADAGHYQCSAYSDASPAPVTHNFTVIVECESTVNHHQSLCSFTDLFGLKLVKELH